LKIVASADIGKLGTKEGLAVTYNWKWYYNIPSVILWVILFGAIILTKANRNPRTLLIILPLLAVNLIWFGFVKLLNFPSLTIMQFNLLFNSLTVGITLLWLLAHKLGNRNRFITFLLALIIMIVISIIGQATNGKFSEQTIIFLSFIIVLSLAVLISFVLAGWRCRTNYNGLRFILWLALWSIIASLAAMMIFMVFAWIVQRPPINMLKSILLQVLIMGLVTGLLLYAINLPFMILAFYSPFFRERFYACLRLKSMPTTAAQADADRPGEQNPDPGTSEKSNSV